MNATTVMEQSGEYSLMFFHINAMRTHYKLMNDRKTEGLTAMRQQTWHTAKKQMPQGVPFFCVAVQSIPGNGPTKANFRIIGILSCYDTYEDAERVSLAWRTKHKYFETNEEKVQYTRAFIQGLRDDHELQGTSSDFSITTMNKFLELTAKEQK